MNNYFLHPTSIVDEDSEIGEKTKIWHFSHVLKNVTIGSNCSIGQNVVIGPNVEIGSGSKIQNNVSVYDGVEIQEDVFLGPSCVFTNVQNPRAFIERKDEFKKTIVKRGASIGANATILCGIIIGKYAMVGAGAVVTKDVKDFSVVIGNPARHYKWVSKYGAILDDSLTCHLTGTEYKIIDNNLIKKK